MHYGFASFINLPVSWHYSGQKAITGCQSDCVVTTFQNPHTFVLKPSGPYAGAYFWTEMSVPDLVQVVVLRYSIAVIGDNVQALESDSFQLSRNGWTYNGGLQADLKDTKMWRMFDFVGKKWVSLFAISQADLVARELNVEAAFQVDEVAHTVTLIGFATPYFSYEVNKTLAAKNDYAHTKFGRGWQVDLAKGMTQVEVNIRRHGLIVL